MVFIRDNQGQVVEVTALEAVKQKNLPISIHNKRILFTQSRNLASQATVTTDAEIDTELTKVLLYTYSNMCFKSADKVPGGATAQFLETPTCSAGTIMGQHLADNKAPIDTFRQLTVGEAKPLVENILQVLAERGMLRFAQPQEKKEETAPTMVRSEDYRANTNQEEEDIPSINCPPINDRYCPDCPLYLACPDSSYVNREDEDDDDND